MQGNPTQVSHRWAPKTCHWNSLPSLAGNRLSSYSSKDISGACGMILYNKNIKLWYYSTSPAYKVPITTVETQTQRTDLWTVWEAEEGWTERVSWGQTHHRGQSSQPLGIWCRTRGQPSARDLRRRWAAVGDGREAQGGREVFIPVADPGWWQKPTQFCKAIIFKLKKKIKKKESHVEIWPKKQKENRKIKKKPGAMGAD